MIGRKDDRTRKLVAIGVLAVTLAGGLAWQRTHEATADSNNSGWRSPPHLPTARPRAVKKPSLRPPQLPRVQWRGDPPGRAGDSPGERAARKRGRGVAEAERNLWPATQVYGFAQEVVLHEEERKHAGSPGAGGPPRRPHWRRGHWKMHAYDPGLRQWKRLFISPVLVNRHRLPGGAVPF